MKQTISDFIAFNYLFIPTADFKTVNCQNDVILLRVFYLFFGTSKISAN